MFEQIGNAVRSEVEEDRDYNCFVSYYAHVGHSPMGTVGGTDGDVFFLLYPCFFKKAMEFFYLNCHLAKSVTVTSDVVQCRFVPVFTSCILKSCQIVWIFFHV